MAPKSKEVLTGPDVEKHRFTWTIRHFDMVRKTDSEFKSQMFEFQAGETLGLKTDWTCKLEETVLELNEEEPNPKWIGISLVASKLPAGVQELKVVFGLKIRGPNGEDGHFVKGVGLDGYYMNFCTEPTNLIAVGSCGSDFVLPRECKLDDLPLINGSLIIEVELKIYGKLSNDLSVIKKTFQPKFRKNIQRDLGTLLDGSTSSPSNAEAKIISKDKVEFIVHRAILSARSPVFERMFLTDMKETRTGVIEIPELGSKTLAVLLKFLYTGKLQKDWYSAEVIVELVYAVDKYQVRDLSKFLDRALGAVCSKETAGKLFNLASKLGLKKARRDLFEFIKAQLSDPDDLDFFSYEINFN